MVYIEEKEDNFVQEQLPPDAIRRKNIRNKAIRSCNHCWKDTLPFTTDFG